MNAADYLGTILPTILILTGLLRTFDFDLEGKDRASAFVAILLSALTIGAIVSD